MLAPVLARLSALPGVSEALVECSGGSFLLLGPDPAALERALPAARAVLGPRTRRVEGAEAAAQLAARPRGEPWFSAATIRGLSYIEGRILAGRVRDAAVAAARLAPEDAARVHEAARVEIFAALDHAHDTGGRASTGWFAAAWPGIAAAIRARLDGLPPGPRAAVAEALAAFPTGGA